MGGGYVLDFSNRTFEEFVQDCVGREIYSAKYDRDSGSKANRLRQFWAVEPNHVVGRLLAGLLQYCDSMSQGPDNPRLREACAKIARRLQEAPPVTDLESLSVETAGPEFEALSKAVQQAIDNDQPETGLDRLHTFVVKYVRVLCERHGIVASKDKPLHSLFGEYVKYLRASRAIESVMTERILKSSISTLEAFNEVRNQQSLAHDNTVLNYDESLLIFNHVASSIRFLQSLEKRLAGPDVDSAAEDEDAVFF